jgi:hypothetical protein
MCLCVCVWAHVRTVFCDLHYQMLYSIKKHKPERPLVSPSVNVCCSCVFVIAPVLFLYSCLSLEAETWRRTAYLALSATDKYWVSDLHNHVYVINQEACGNEIKYLQFWVFLKIWDLSRNVWIARVSKCMTGLGTLFNYGYSFSHDFTWQYWHSVSFS